MRNINLNKVNCQSKWEDVKNKNDSVSSCKSFSNWAVYKAQFSFIINIPLFGKIVQNGCKQESLEYKHILARTAGIKYMYAKEYFKHNSSKISKEQLHLSLYNFRN